MPSPKIKQELRQAWREQRTDQIKSAFEKFGLKAELKDSGARHFKITGGVRPVELYASTGTVNASPYKKFKSTTVRGMTPNRAFSRAISLVRFGH
jgi:hypothetical protein